MSRKYIILLYFLISLVFKQINSIRKCIDYDEDNKTDSEDHINTITWINAGFKENFFEDAGTNKNFMVNCDDGIEYKQYNAN